MNILEGVKPSNPKACSSAKFIIKSKPSAKDTRPDPDAETVYSSNQDVHQLITYMANKSRRLADLLEAKAIQDVGDFYSTSLYANPCIVSPPLCSAPSSRPSWTDSWPSGGWAGTSRASTGASSPKSKTSSGTASRGRWPCTSSTSSTRRRKPA